MFGGHTNNPYRHVIKRKTPRTHSQEGQEGAIDMTVLLTSLVMPPCCLTACRARLNLATFAIVSAAKHFRILYGESSILTMTGKPLRSTMLRLI